MRGESRCSSEALSPGAFSQTPSQDVAVTSTKFAHVSREAAARAACLRGVLLSGGMAPRPKDMVRLAQLKVQSYHKKFITDGCADISSSAVQMGLQIGGIVPLPTKKRLITILKGPFVDKKALQQHHHATHKRLIELYGKSTTGQCATSCVHFLRYLEHTIMQLHPGISVRVTLFSDEVAEAQGGARSAVVRAAIGADALPPPQS